MTLDPERFEEAIRLFERVRALSPEERLGWLEKATVDDDVRDHVRTLLGHLDGFESSRTPIFETRADDDDGDGEEHVPDHDRHDARDGLGGRPRRVGHYRLISELGRGGMGSVWLAEQEEPMRRVVALKLIRPGVGSAAAVARFKAERQALARMEHPGIARVYEAGATQDGQPWFAMEHVDGVPITTWADREQATIAERLELFLQVLAAVEHAHRKGIIHRDLKPSNILVTREENAWRAKVIDFGIAKSLDEPLGAPGSETRAGDLLGTPAYMSPEQARGNSADLDTRSDVYALGLILHELLVGRLPFGETVIAERGFVGYLRTLVEEDPPRPSARMARLDSSALAEILERRRSTQPQLERALRADLDWVLLRALEREPGRRYGSVGELARDIERFLANEPVSARSSTLGYRLAKLARRRRRTLVVTGTMLALLVLSGFFAAHLSSSRTRSNRARESRELLQQGLGARRTYTAEREHVDSLRRRWEKKRSELPSWAPIWRRYEELDAWVGWREAHRGLPKAFHRAHVLLQRAFEAAPTDGPEASRARDALRELYFLRFDEVYWGADRALDPDYYAGLVELLGERGAPTRFDDRRRARISLRTDPPGVEVWCFRQELVEGRLVPHPWNPARGVYGETGLIVERVWSDAASHFRANDRIVSIAGSPVRVLRDLVRALEEVRETTVAVEIERDGERETFAWRLPTELFPETARESQSAIEGDAATTSESDAASLTRTSARPKLLTQDHIRTILGLTFAAYPLDTSGAPVGITSSERPLELDLEEGSWLLLLRKPGFTDLRVPIRAPWLPGFKTDLSFRLLAEDETPPGFVPIVAGPFVAGGDPEVHQALPFGYPTLPFFLMARHEVTIAEWFEFLNAPDVRSRMRTEAASDVDESDIGSVTPRSEAARALLPSPGGRVLLVPKSDKTGGLLARYEDGRWMWTYSAPPDWPIFGVSLAAAHEYAHWLTERSGGRFRFRIPSDLEWEKAARGVDGRPFVWGEYLHFGFCRSSVGQAGPDHDDRYTPCPVGAYPTDESVWGVRDLAGSVEEWTADRVGIGDLFWSARGGDWYTWNDYTFRAANRNGYPPLGTATNRGVRLVAEPIAEP